MIYRILCVILLSCIYNLSESQTPYYFSEDINTLHVNPYFKELYKSFRGKIDKSPEEFELPLEVTRYHALNGTDSTYFEEFEQYSAYDEILKLADMADIR